MSKKWYPYIIIIVLLIALVAVRLIKNESIFQPVPVTKRKTTNGSTIDRDRGFDRRISYLKYSNHAKCRMKCRKISQSEVEEIMQDGKINYNKSEIRNARCPRYAVEGRTHDNQQVRIVFAQCNESTTVVTVIDLETEFECHCPGDDDKYKNQN